MSDLGFCRACNKLIRTNSNGEEFIVLPVGEEGDDTTRHEELWDVAKREAPLSEQGLTVKPKDVMFTDNIKEF